MISVLTTKEFDNWLSSQQPKARVIIKARLDLIAINHFGDHKRFEELIEFRWKNGNRIYAFTWNKLVIVVLYGGNKNGQNKDIQKAKKIREEILKGTRAIFK